MELSEEQIDEVVRAAELHDVGKMAIPDTILDKPGPLNAKERDFMRRHTLLGERILERPRPSPQSRGLVRVEPRAL